MRIGKIFCLTLGLAGIYGCSLEETEPYFKIAGGGFVFNYRIAEATAGVVVTPERALPADGSFEAIFVNPAGGAPFIMREKASPTKKRYDFTTPPLSGVKAKTDYVMTVRLLDADGNEIGMAEKALRSDLDQLFCPTGRSPSAPATRATPRRTDRHEPAPADPAQAASLQT